MGRDRTHLSLPVTQKNQSRRSEGHDVWQSEGLKSALSRFTPPSNPEFTPVIWANGVQFLRRSLFLTENTHSTSVSSVRVKGGVSLRNGLWHGLGKDIIRRNLIYGKWCKEIKLNRKETRNHPSKETPSMCTTDYGKIVEGAGESFDEEANMLFNILFIEQNDE